MQTFIARLVRYSNDTLSLLGNSFVFGLKCSTEGWTGWFRECSRFVFTAGEASAAARKSVDGAEFIAGGAVFLLLGDGGKVGEVVGGGHGDGAHPEAGEGGVAVEERAVFGVCVEEVKGFGMCGLGLLYVAEEAAEDGEFEGVEEEGEGGLGRKRVAGGVGVVESEGREGVGL